MKISKFSKILICFNLLFFLIFNLIVSFNCQTTIFSSYGFAYALDSKLASYQTSSQTTFAAASIASSQITYAKVKSGCILYKTENLTNTSVDNIYFEVPETYFVTIENAASSPSAVHVKYADFIGFVDPLTIKTVELTPASPTLLGVTFSISSGTATQLRSTPDASISSNIITTIPSNTQNIPYIAQISATVPTGGASDVWYFAQYSPASSPTSVYYGYVYSERTTNLSKITSNTENDIIINPDYPSQAFDDEDKVSISMPVKVVLISLICLPVIMLFIILFFKIKSHKKLSTVNTNSNIAGNFSNNFTGQNTIKNRQNSRTLHAFKDKPFYRLDKFKNALNQTLKNSNNHVNKSQSNFSLDNLDDEDLL